MGGLSVYPRPPREGSSSGYSSSGANKLRILESFGSSSIASNSLAFVASAILLAPVLARFSLRQRSICVSTGLTGPPRILISLYLRDLLIRYQPPSVQPIKADTASVPVYRTHLWSELRSTANGTSTPSGGYRGECFHSLTISTCLYV
jgi:hypothetical protein